MSGRQNVSDRHDGLNNQGQHGSEDRHLDGRENVELPEGVELSVYRIVQEALTNVAKHAAPAKCRVSVVAYKGEVRIEVIDDGPGHRAPLDDVSGHGLIGMRERVMMYGGVFEASDLPERGFRVAAQLPFGGAA
jgi:signal transduction histidine kinase